MDISHVARVSGIYAITHIASGKIYVGSAINLRVRAAKHRWSLRRGDHSNARLQHAFNKYGADAFVFSVLELCESACRIEREQQHIDLTNCCDTSVGYNIRPRADAKIISDETRKKLSIAGMGHPISAETRALWSAQRRKPPKSDEEKAVIRTAHNAKRREERALKPKPERRKYPNRKRSPPRKGVPLTAEHKRKISETNRARHQRLLAEGHCFSPSAETRAKMSAAGRGKKKPPGMMEKLRLAKIGVPRSEETRAKLRAAQLGKMASAEARAKQSAALIERHRQKREVRQKCQGRLFPDRLDESISATTPANS